MRGNARNKGKVPDVVKTISSMATILAMFGLLAARTAQAQDDFFDVNLGAAGYVGTTGVGLQGNVSLNEYISVIAGADWLFLRLDFNEDVGDILIEDGHFSLSSMVPYGMIGVHPFRDGLRFAAGLANANLSSTGKFSYQASSYQGDIDIGVKNTQSLAPIVVAGFAHNPKGGLGLYLEGGVMFPGDLETSIKVTDNCGTSNLCTNEREETTRLTKTAVDDIFAIYPGYYPIARFGLRVSF